MWTETALTGFPDGLRLAPMAVGSAWRRARARAQRALGAISPFGGRVPDRLLIVPPDLRTSDPTIAIDIYGGYFALAGRVVASKGRSPFDLTPPSTAWAQALLGFGWLRHLRAAETALARANARVLITDFVQGGHNRSALAEQPKVIARRIVSWLSHSPLVLEGADHDFYRLFLRALTRDAADLARISTSLEGEARMNAAIALTFCGLCMSDADHFMKRGLRLLRDALRAQIMPDGGHVSRNPRLVADLLTDLLPLRQTFAARAVETPAELHNAIDRMMPMLRLFRHSDGSLALFNGMGVTRHDLIATLLAYDEARASPIQHAPHSGYERIACGQSTLVMDVGSPPPAAFSGEAHAGALAFEFSSGFARIIVNCGSPAGASSNARRMARHTAAHSTLTIGETSSCRFSGEDAAGADAYILSGPSQVEALRTTLSDGSVDVTAVQDGYRDLFGLIHERRLRLDGAGERLIGRDSIVGDARGGSSAPAVLRFHLHPGIKASRIGDGRSVMLVLPQGEAWTFESERTATIEESVFFAAPEGSRRTEQIVIPLDAAPGVTIRWSLSRIGQTTPRAGQTRTEANQTLPGLGETGDKT